MENWLQILIFKNTSKRLKHPIEIIGFSALIGFIAISLHKTDTFYIGMVGLIILLFIVILFLLPFWEKNRNKNLHFVNETYSNNIVDNRNLQVKIDLQNNQIDVLKEI